jgi:DNA-binding SARP family transcriptional activator/tetratricopeptide (TPR) repeat protein
VTDTVTLELRLLGPPALRLAGAEISPPTRKSLALLAYLALEGSQPRGKLADLLWSDLDEDAARKNLRKELFRLRGSPLEPFIHTPEDRVELIGFEVDARRFANSTESDEPTALEHHHGGLLEGFNVPGAIGFEDWLETSREHFSGLLVRALANRVRALETNGDLRAAVQTQQRLVALDELQESATRGLMRLHAKLGDRVAALEAFDRFERILKSELGLQPLPETIALARRIEVAQDDEPTAQPETPNSPRLERPPLVGRDAAWSWLEQPHDGVRLLLAESGVGKTRLATDYARTRGFTFTMRGFEAAASTPLYPIAEALRSRLEQDSTWLETLDPGWRREAARLVPELWPERTGSDGPPSSEGRARFLEGLTRAVLAAMPRPSTLLLDDLHWFDASSLELILHLIRKLEADVLVIATARPFEASENSTVTTTLNALEREGKLERYPLEPLTATQTRSLIQALSGERAERFSERLHNATGGNVLFALETLRGLFSEGLLRLADDGGWITPFDESTEDYTELPIPSQVREIALARIARLGPACGRWLEASSLAGEPFEANWMEGATALSEWESLEALERAVQAQVLEAVGPAGSNSGEYRFIHDLVRRSLSDGLSLERRKLIHRRLASNLISERAAPGLIADHLESAGRNQEAIQWHVKAFEAAQTVYAHAEARARIARALALEPDEHTSFKLHRDAAGLELMVLNLDALESHAKAMLEVAVHLQDKSLEAEASLMLARTRLYRADFMGGLELAERADALAADPSGETALVLATALIACGRASEAEPILIAALERTTGKTQGDLHGILKVLYQQRGELEHSVTHGRAALEAYRTARAREDELKTLAQLAQTLGQLGRSNEALELLETAVREARALGFERSLALALTLQAEEGLRVNNLETAGAAIAEGLELSRGKSLAREAQLESLAGRVHRRAGRYGAAVTAAQVALALTERLGLPAQSVVQHLVNAELWLDLGAFELAQQTLDAARESLQGSNLQAYTLPLETLHARLELESDPVAARARLEPLLEIADRAPPEQHAAFVCVHASALIASNDFSQALGVVRSLDAPGWMRARLESVRQRAEKLRPFPTDLQKILAHAPPLESLELLCLLEPNRTRKLEIEHLEQQLIGSLDGFPDLSVNFRSRLGTLRERGKAHDVLRSEP